MPHSASITGTRADLRTLMILGQRGTHRTVNFAGDWSSERS